MKLKKGSKKIAESTVARIEDGDEVLDMEVGQDTEFIEEENSDEESNVVTLNMSRASRGHNPDEVLSKNKDEESEKDKELDVILDHNYRIAGLIPNQRESQNTVRSNGAEGSEFLDMAMSKFQEVFMNSEFMETANKMQLQMEKQQKQLMDSQRKIDAQARELERVKKQAQTTSKGNGIPDKNEILRKKARAKSLNEILSKASDSELTVYRSAVENLISKRDSSSSSEDGLNSSEEIRPIEILQEDMEEEDNHSLIEQFISDAREKHQSKSVTDPGFPQGGGVNPPRGGCEHTILPNSPKNCMKLKEFGRRGGGRASLTPPLRSATA